LAIADLWIDDWGLLIWGMIRRPPIADRQLPNPQSPIANRQFPQSAIVNRQLQNPQSPVANRQ
jgi:hypothetical protein